MRFDFDKFATNVLSKEKLRLRLPEPQQQKNVRLVNLEKQFLLFKGLDVLRRARRVLHR